MEKIKGMLLFLAYIGACSVMDSVDAGTLDFKYAIILALVSLVSCIAYFMYQKKKSVASRKYNGQAHKVHTYYIHDNYTPKRDGVSSEI